MSYSSWCNSYCNVLQLLDVTPLLDNLFALPFAASGHMWAPIKVHVVVLKHTTKALACQNLQLSIATTVAATVKPTRQGLRSCLHLTILC